MLRSLTCTEVSNFVHDLIVFLCSFRLVFDRQCFVKIRVVTKSDSVAEYCKQAMVIFLRAQHFILGLSGINNTYKQVGGSRRFGIVQVGT